VSTTNLGFGYLGTEYQPFDKTCNTGQLTTKKNQCLHSRNLPTATSKRKTFQEVSLRIEFWALTGEWGEVRVGPERVERSEFQGKGNPKIADLKKEKKMRRPKNGGSGSALKAGEGQPHKKKTQDRKAQKPPPTPQKKPQKKKKTEKTPTHPPNQPPPQDEVKIQLLMKTAKRGKRYSRLVFSTRLREGRGGIRKRKIKIN